VVIRPLGDVIVIMPPLSISIDHLQQLVDTVFYSIEQVTSSCGG
jgi:adenosylmethionine-8-amino-7-oxononanoate aminotransferase